MRVIDADGAILGRMSSAVAKMLLNGEKVVVINAEKAVISGSKEDIFERYKQRRDRADRANPRKGPKFPRVPDRLVRRTIRGMVNYKTKRGRQAMKNLRVYMGETEELKKKSEKLCKPKHIKNGMSVEELCRLLGWKNPKEER